MTGEQEHGSPPQDNAPEQTGEEGEERNTSNSDNEIQNLQERLQQMREQLNLAIEDNARLQNMGAERDQDEKAFKRILMESNKACVNNMAEAFASAMQGTNTTSFTRKPQAYEEKAPWSDQKPFNTNANDSPASRILLLADLATSVGDEYNQAQGILHLCKKDPQAKSLAESHRRRLETISRGIKSVLHSKTTELPSILRDFPVRAEDIKDGLSAETAFDKMAEHSRLMFYRELLKTSTSTNDTIGAMRALEKDFCDRVQQLVVKFSHNSSAIHEHGVKLRTMLSAYHFACSFCHDPDNHNRSVPDWTAETMYITHFEDFCIDKYLGLLQKSDRSTLWAIKSSKPRNEYWHFPAILEESAKLAKFAGSATVASDQDVRAPRTTPKLGMYGGAKQNDQGNTGSTSRNSGTPCRYYSRAGSCRNKNCTFAHVGNGDTGQRSVNDNKTHYRDESKKEDAPLCYDFLKGRCARVNCNFLHDQRVLSAVQSNQLAVSAGKKSTLYSSNARGTRKQQRHDGMDDNDTDEGYVSEANRPRKRQYKAGYCWAFLDKGNCSKENCTFKHERPPQLQRQDPTSVQRPDSYFNQQEKAALLAQVHAQMRDNAKREAALELLNSFGPAPPAGVPPGPPSSRSAATGKPGE